MRMRTGQTTKREYVEPSVSYHDELIKDLKNPAEASDYLNFALEEGDREQFFSGAAECGRGSRGVAQAVPADQNASWKSVSHVVEKRKS